MKQITSQDHHEINAVYSKQAFHSMSQVEWMLVGYRREEPLCCIPRQHGKLSSIQPYRNSDSELHIKMYHCVQKEGIIVSTCCHKGQEVTFACSYILKQQRNTTTSIPWLLRSLLLTRSDGFPSCEQHGRQKRNQQQKNQSHVVFRRTSTSNHVGDRVDNKKPEENLSTTVSCIHSLR